ncbi:MAG: ABC transporter ATP-binding protein [Bryobacterales bacterium]|nr:ABC transporter ATP-binding protein [Bryobacterales bacterium]MDE0625959.1 ABC transporter ATP-binding protein [Bryobacterales bacterium]
MARIAFNSVSKSYSSYPRPSDRLRELFRPGHAAGPARFQALQEVSFEVGAGETLCVIGANGSGKSTSLQIAARILRPTSGTVEIEGRVSALLDLGAGFHPEFTGRENVRLCAALHGLSNRDTRARLPEIEAFAEIGEFIDRPVRTYSSGMLVRLAFAAAISMEPEILLVDEALAVGDYYFRQRCMRRVHELRAQGVTILFVSHSMADVQALGTRALWLDRGRVAGQGDPATVVRNYLARMKLKDRESSAEPRGAREPSSAVAEGVPNVDRRFGTRRAEVTGIAVLDASARPVRSLAPSQTAIVRISARARDRIERPNIGFMLRNHLGIDFAGTNTVREGLALEPMRPGEVRTVDFHIDLPELHAGSFSFAPAVADGGLADYEICDWIDNALALPMERGAGEVYGYMHLPCRVEVGRQPSPAAKPRTEAP